MEQVSRVSIIFVLIRGREVLVAFTSMLRARSFSNWSWGGLGMGDVLELVSFGDGGGYGYTEVGVGDIQRCGGPTFRFE